MFSPADREAILHFVFSSEENVKMALAVSAVRREIKKKIIAEFAKKLECDLREGAKKLGETWEVVSELKGNPFDRWWQIYMAKRDWNDL
jgi:hypothetical protein